MSFSNLLEVEMKAAVYTKYGPPEVVTLRDVLRPSPKKDQILVKIYASTVNRNDCGFRAPEYPLIVRPLHGLFRPRQTILGTEFAGTVEEIGSDVSTFTIGDRVFGLTGNSFGTHAEFVCVAEGLERSSILFSSSFHYFSFSDELITKFFCFAWSMAITFQFPSSLFVLCQ